MPISGPFVKPAHSMSSVTTDNLLEPLVKRARRLYTLPAVAMQVVELTNQPTIDAKALKECMENDPALTTKVLRVVNSPLYGLSGQVTDLNQALALLGTKPLKLLVLGFSLPQELLAGLPAQVLGRYWRKTVIKAVAAREIAEALWKAPGDEAFIAALLQDLGMLALIQDLGEPYIRFLDRVFGECDDLSEHERRTLGFDHVTLTSRLLDEWGLPRSLVDAVAQPFEISTLLHLPKAAQALPQILHLVDLFAEFLIQQRPRLLDGILEAGGAYCGLTMDQIEAVITQLETKVPQLADILSLQLPEDASYTAILLQAYAQINDVAEAGTHELPNLKTDDGTTDNAALLGAIEQLASQPDPLATAATAGPATVVDARLDQVTMGLTALASTCWPDLLQLVEAAVYSCRQARCACSLILLEVDHADSFMLRQGPQRAAQSLRRLQATIEARLDRDGRVVQCDDYRFAVLLEDCERQDSVELARQFVEVVRRRENAAAGSIAFSLSAGVATLSIPSKNFPSEELVEAAERCLNGVKLCGGDSVKSIDIF